MIYLNVQLKLMIFSFIFGFFFGWIIDKYSKYCGKLKYIIGFIIFMIIDILYFIGIYIISNAVFHIYSVLSIIMGFIVYNVIMKKIA